VKVLHHRERIDAVGSLAVVIHDTPDRARRGFLHDLKVDAPVLVDLDMAAYRAWGLRRAGVREAYGSPRVWWGYARQAIAEGQRPGVGSDPRQLGGDFVVGADGRVLSAHPQPSLDERPPAGMLISELEAAGAASVP